MSDTKSQEPEPDTRSQGPEPDTRSQEPEPDTRSQGPEPDTRSQGPEPDTRQPDTALGKIPGTEPGRILDTELGTCYIHSPHRSTHRSICDGVSPTRWNQIRRAR